MKKMKKLLALLLSVALIIGFTACGNGGPAGAVDEPQIGIIQLMEHPALDAAREGFMAALESEGIAAEYDYQNAQGDATTLSTIAQRFVNNDVDLILAIATGSAQAVAAETQEIPIVGTAITDYEVARLVDSNESPGGNVTGASDMNPIEAQIALIQEFMPEIGTLGIVFSSNEPNSVIQAEIAQAVAESLGMTVVIGTVTNVNDVQQVTTSVANQVDAIYIPTDNTYANAMSLVAQISMETGTPIFGAEPNMVMGGGVATLGIDYFDLGFQSGLMAAQILRGETEPATMPIQWAETYTYTVNSYMVEALGITVPERLLEFIRFSD
ncbi:MAG: ABC transporter substrate-binding protein [Oscillospiraceae bacterium]|nr:ABC transporter substrate-binding protein [Oscillospiraceae bacterium]